MNSTIPLTQLCPPFLALRPSFSSIIEKAVEDISSIAQRVTELHLSSACCKRTVEDIIRFAPATCFKMLRRPRRFAV